MAQRRMFSLRIVSSDAFLDMPVSSQALYFQFGMHADDDGFVGNPRRVMRTMGVTEDDLKILCAKRFILTFESGVVVVKHWRIHNFIQGDRYTETNYKKEKDLLNLNENDAYTDRDTGRRIPLIGKPAWQMAREKARKDSSLPQSFDYKIRHAFLGKRCPICNIEMHEVHVTDSNYGDPINRTPTIQHIIPISKDGKHELGNIAVICGGCNASIGSRISGKLNEKDVEIAWKQVGNKSGTQVRSELGKDRIGITRETREVEESRIEADEDMIPTRSLRSAPKSPTNPIVRWAEERLGHKFPVIMKQKAHVARMVNAGFSEDDIKAEWLRLEKDEYYAGKTFDFATVANEIGKARGKPKSKPGHVAEGIDLSKVKRDPYED